MSDADNRFWVLGFDDRDHLKDAINSLANGEISCIVDEQEGGIIAYVINPLGSRRADIFVDALNSCS